MPLRRLAILTYKCYNNRYKRFPIKPKIYKTDKRLTKEHKLKISESMKKYRREHTTLKFNYNGEMLSIPELAERLNIKEGTLRARYERTGSVFLGGAKMDGGKEE